MSAPALPSAQDREAGRQATQWLVRLHSGEAGEADLAACRRWREAHPSHERAWQKAERLMTQFGAVPTAIAWPILNRRRSRRAVLGAWAALGASAPLAWMAWRSAPWESWVADYATATGERKQVTLPDGSRLWLNTGTVVDLAWTDTLRLVRLRRGEIQVQTAPDAAGRDRPFVVETAEGRMRALGTRFVVRRDEGADDSALTVLEHRVEITPRARTAPVVVPAGQHTHFSHDAVEALAPNVSLPLAGPDGAPGWLQGVLYADDARLGDFVRDLARYRPGVLRCAPEIADLRISGAYRLADTDAVLALLQEALPVRVVQRTRWWVSVVPRAAG